MNNQEKKINLLDLPDIIIIKIVNYITNSDLESIKLGRKFSNNLKQGTIVGLNGEIGSGKTTFIKGILEGLNYKHDVTSPTFTLINEYDADLKVIHIDFYREENIERWKNMGFEEILYNNDVILIEWSNLIPDLLPKDILILNFKHIKENKRKIYLK